MSPTPTPNPHLSLQSGADTVEAADYQESQRREISLMKKMTLYMSISLTGLKYPLS